MEGRSGTAKFYEWAQHASLGWYVFSYLFPAGAAVVTGWLARLQDTPWYLVVFYSSGVFMFGIVSAANLVRARWELTLKYKLTCDDFDTLIFNTAPNKVSIVLSCYFNNLSQMPIEFSLENVSVSLQGKINQNIPDSVPTRSISPDGFVPFSWGAIDDIDVRQPVFGNFKFTAKYGAVGANQNRKLEERFAIEIRISKQRDGKYAALNAIGSESRVYS